MQSGFLIDGNDLAATYEVYVQKTKGALDFLKRKGDTAHNWLDSNGEEAFVGANDIYFEARDIVLTCHIKASSKATFLTNLVAFKAVLESAGLHVLKLPFETGTRNVYFVAGGALELLTTWNNSTLVGKFLLQLREPNPATAS